MAIGSISGGAPAQSQAEALQPGRAGGVRPGPAGAQQEQRARMNAEIVQASLEVSIKSGNEPLQLTFRAVIDSLNDILRPEFGDNAIEAAASQDNSPEGTAGRIVALSTAFFEAFAAQRPGADRDQILNDFLDVIGGGIAQGFAEARDILRGLKVLDGDIAANIDRTEVLVRDGLAAFAERMRQPPPAAGEAGPAG